jgi:hypothetical protein
VDCGSRERLEYDHIVPVVRGGPKLLIVGLAVLGIATGPAVSAPSPAVPLAVQHAIKKRVSPLAAYLPSRVPAGYRYRTWQGSKSGFEIWFGQLAFGAGVAHSCSVGGSPMKTFRLAGVNVFWSATYEDQQAWRCVRRGHVTILLQSGQSIPGDDGTNTPKTLRDALLLARLVASARPIA